MRPGLPGRGAFHRFRKTTGSLVHERRTARQLGDWLGHADPGFSVRTYTAQMDDELGSAAFLDELIPVGGCNRVAT
jgi:integrase